MNLNCCPCRVHQSHLEGVNRSNSSPPMMRPTTTAMTAGDKRLSKNRPQIVDIITLHFDPECPCSNSVWKQHLKSPPHVRLMSRCSDWNVWHQLLLLSVLSHTCHCWLHSFHFLSRKASSLCGTLTMSQRETPRMTRHKTSQQCL